jgi:exosortase A-associated hydrolase 1
MAAMRQLITIPCADSYIAATIDPATGPAGIVIVGGGTQIRIGAHRGFVELGTRLAAAGYPVIRFDRRGVGDSGGDDPGFADSGADIAAAAAALRDACPQLTQLIGFGLCDGASALVMHHRAAGIDRLLLANPWLADAAGGLPPPAAIRRHYRDKLSNPAAWRRLISGRVDYRRLARGLARVGRQAPAPLAQRLATALRASDAPVTLLLAEGDATAIGFADAWRKSPFAGLAADIVTLPTAAHTFARAGDDVLLAKACLAALAD